MVMVGVDDQLGGAIELEAAVRPEVREIIRGLRDRGIKHIAIISGDHEAPTRKLAESLGMDRYFAQVLPADKADYVAKLQAEGGKVCFVGDGINDSIALKKADVSISLRGASSIATDTAHIVFLEGGLSKLCDLRDIARDLDRNVNRSWSMIVAPNVTNVVGVFTMGFGIMTSVITNNVSALFALGNGLLPLRKIARAEADRRRDRETSAGRAGPARPRPDAATWRPAGVPIPAPINTASSRNRRERVAHSKNRPTLTRKSPSRSGMVSSSSAVSKRGRSVGPVNVCQPALVVEDDDDGCPRVEVLRHLREHLRPAVRR